MVHVYDPGPFEAKFGERGDTEKAMGDKVQEHGIMGSNGLFKTHMLEMLIWHEYPEKAPKHIGDAIDGSSYEGSFGAPLDLLISMKKTFEDKTDKEKEKLQKKNDDDKILLPLTFLEDKREQHEGFQEKMLSEIEKGNDQFVKSAESTKAFQTDFLSLIGKAFASCD
ncbi:hypothetical protein PILCRDRAFT_16465 [Piloderma croceum F 1598]|uniref:Uncharacterized protein n=1 Tax=Piloderma croceum (strain F 1598) TaxID=765440 RepID=A0A0C3EVP3_PILCF|nr:hypothetical protein PILCRDRAFT_16465 [Piloderma croceum F 1598]